MGKRLGDERLRGEVITLVELDLADDVEDRRITLETRGVELQAIEQMRDAVETPLGIFERYAPHKAVHLVTALEQKLGEVAAILARDACDECFFHFRSARVFLCFAYVNQRQARDEATFFVGLSRNKQTLLVAILGERTGDVTFFNG